ncbi:hypothetical protein J437_LFUL015197, partial [Ladona fulva]
MERTLEFFCDSNGAKPLGRSSITKEWRILSKDLFSLNTRAEFTAYSGREEYRKLAIPASWNVEVQEVEELGEKINSGEVEVWAWKGAMLPRNSSCRQSVEVEDPGVGSENLDRSGSHSLLSEQALQEAEAKKLREERSRGNSSTNNKRGEEESHSEGANVDTSWGRCENSSSIPLLHLVKQLLRSVSSLTQSHLWALAREGSVRDGDSVTAQEGSKCRGMSSRQGHPSSETKETGSDGGKTPSGRERKELSSPSLSLLLRFQRLLVAHLYQAQQVRACQVDVALNKTVGNSKEKFRNRSHQELQQDALGAESLLGKYVHLVCCHVKDTLHIASRAASASQRHFSSVTSILESDVVELVLCLVLVGTQGLGLKAGGVAVVSSDRGMQPMPPFSPLLLLHLRSTWLPSLASLLDALDRFNRLAPGVLREDCQDMAWPGIV